MKLGHCPSDIQDILIRWVYITKTHTKRERKERSVLDGGPGVSLPHKVDAISTAMSRAARQ